MAVCLNDSLPLSRDSSARCPDQFVWTGGAQVMTNEAGTNVNIAKLRSQEPDARAMICDGFYCRGSGRLELGPQGQCHQYRCGRALVLGNSSADKDDGIFGELPEDQFRSHRVTCDPHADVAIEIQ
jgi:hypothetical protein